MERNYYLQPEFNGGETFQADDEAFINGSLSYQSVLSLGQVKPPPPSLSSSFHPNISPFYTSASSSSSSQFMQQTALAYIKTENDVVHMTHQQLKYPKFEPESKQLKYPKFEPENKQLKYPKFEPENYDTLQLYPYNNNNKMFLNEPPFNYCSDGGYGYRLPHSRDFQLGDSSGSKIIPKPKREKKAYAAARVRRQTISDKTRCLEKLMPWNRKMTTAIMLEEAYKYIKFLQAQINVLNNMPLLRQGGADRNGKSSSSSLLERLNRQQLLQVVLNSPVAQTYFYSKACCLYSAEQLKKRNHQTQMLYSSPTLP